MNFSIGANQSNSTAVNTTPNDDRHTSPLATGLNSLINTYVSEPLTNSANITQMLDAAGQYLDNHPDMEIQLEHDFRTLLNLHVESAPPREIDLMLRFLNHRSTTFRKQPPQNSSRDLQRLPTPLQASQLGRLNNNLLQHTSQFMNANDILTLGNVQKKMRMAMRQSLDMEILAQKYSTEIKKQLAGLDEQAEYETLHKEVVKTVASFSPVHRWRPLAALAAQLFCLPIECRPQAIHDLARLAADLPEEDKIKLLNEWARTIKNGYLNQFDKVTPTWCMNTILDLLETIDQARQPAILRALLIKLNTLKPDDLEPIFTRMLKLIQSAGAEDKILLLTTAFQFLPSSAHSPDLNFQALVQASLSLSESHQALVFDAFLSLESRRALNTDRLNLVFDSCVELAIRLGAHDLLKKLARFCALVNDNKKLSLIQQRAPHFEITQDPDVIVIQSIKQLEKNPRITTQMTLEAAQKLPPGAQNRFWREAAKLFYYQRKSTQAIWPHLEHIPKADKIKLIISYISSLFGEVMQVDFVLQSAAQLQDAEVYLCFAEYLDQTSEESLPRILIQMDEALHPMSPEEQWRMARALSASLATIKHSHLALLRMIGSIAARLPSSVQQGLLLRVAKRFLKSESARPLRDEGLEMLRSFARAIPDALQSTKALEEIDRIEQADEARRTGVAAPV